jgi:hypothetical protein
MIRLNNQIDCRFQFALEVILGTFNIRHRFASYSNRGISQKAEERIPLVSRLTAAAKTEMLA